MSGSNDPAQAAPQGAQTFAWGSAQLPVGFSRDHFLMPSKRRGRKAAHKPATQHPESGTDAHAEYLRAVVQKRQSGSVCVRCSISKIRCTIDQNALGKPCTRCAQSMAVCIRNRIDDSALYRNQDAPFGKFSQRWKSMDLIDIPNWANDNVRSIKLSIEYVDAPYELKVREFVPLPGDMLEEQWTTNGKIVYYPLPAYGIAVMEDAAVSIHNMVEREIGNFVVATLDQRKSADLVQQTYLAAFRRVGNAPTSEERALLANAFRLWVLCRIHSNSEHIVGEDTLDTQAVDDPDSPYHGCVLASPVLMAQLECIYYSKFLRPQSNKVLLQLRFLMETKRREYWYTIYLTLFILLHSCSMTTRRDKEYASSINLSSTFCNPDGITQHNVGSKTLLAQFHMGLKGSLPFKLALEGNLHAEQYSGVFTPSEIGFIRWSAIEAATRKPAWGRIRASGDWANDEYWISQLFDDVWPTV